MLARRAIPATGHDYADACEVTSTADRTAAGWLRAMLDDAPVWTRTSLRLGWTVLTVDRPGGRGSVLGWPLVEDDADHAHLHAPARLGFTTDLAITRDGDVVRFETLQSHDTRLAGLVWAPIAGFHRLTVRMLLASAARRR